MEDEMFVKKDEWERLKERLRRLEEEVDVAAARWRTPNARVDCLALLKDVKKLNDAVFSAESGYQFGKPRLDILSRQVTTLAGDVRRLQQALHIAANAAEHGARDVSSGMLVEEAP